MRIQQWLFEIGKKTKQLLQEELESEDRESMLWWMGEIERFAESNPWPSLVDEWHKLDNSSPGSFATTLWETNPDAERWVRDQNWLPETSEVEDLAVLIDLVCNRSVIGTGHGE